MKTQKLISVLIFILPVVLILWFWKDTLLHIGTQTHDWYDGSFIIWTLQNNIKHFRGLQLGQLYETNAMYPFKYSLSFTDHLYFPSLFATVISYFSSNPILQYNLLSIINHILVFLGFYALAGRFTNNNGARAVGAFYFSFSPYMFTQFGHYQMVFVWPLLLSLHCLLSPKRDIKALIWSGFWLGCQFLTGTYLGLIGLTIVGLLFLAEFIVIRKPAKVFREFAVFFAVFLLVSGVSVYGYFLVNKEYRPMRNQSEYVTYSAHLSDYLFPIQNSVIYNALSPLRSLDNHRLGEHAAFVGFLPLTILGLWFAAKRRMKKSQKLYSMSLRSMLIRIAKWNPVAVWLILLVLCGVIFSIGPRMNWNGKYLVTPLPYWVLLKAFPPIGIMRAVSRWYFMVIFAVSIGMTIGYDRFIKRYPKQGILLILGGLTLAILEFYPTPLRTSVNPWNAGPYVFLKLECTARPTAVLEYPFEYRADDFDYVKNLAYKTNILMFSSSNDCMTLSGFSSFEPPQYLEYKRFFDDKPFSPAHVALLNKLKIGYVKLNLFAIKTDEQYDVLEQFRQAGMRQMYADAGSIIYQVPHMP